MIIPLFPDEKTIALLVLGPGREREWKSIAAHDERKGLPRIDPVHGGRYWPAVEQFYRQLMGYAGAPDPIGGGVRIIDAAPDGKEIFAAIRKPRKRRND